MKKLNKLNDINLKEFNIYFKIKYKLNYCKKLNRFLYIKK